MRRFTIRGLIEFGFGETESMEHVLQEELEEFMRRFDLLVEEKGEVSLHQYFNLPVLNTLWRVMCGTRISSNDEEMRRLVPIIEQAIASASIGTQAIQAFPFLRHIPGITNHQQIVHMFKSLQGIFRVRTSALCTLSLGQDPHLYLFI
jgi:hypothetical protein